MQFSTVGYQLSTLPPSPGERERGRERGRKGSSFLNLCDYYSSPAATSNSDYRGFKQSTVTIGTTCMF